jgi:hypothetical protein
MEFTLKIAIAEGGPMGHGRNIAAALGRVARDLDARSPLFATDLVPMSGEIRDAHDTIVGEWAIADDAPAEVTVTEISDPEAVVRWRSEQACVDWEGDDLRDHLRFHLMQARYIDVPPEYRPALDAFKGLDISSQIALVEKVLA